MSFDEELWAGMDKEASWTDPEQPDEPEPTQNLSTAVELPANLPDEFWNARPLFKQIREAARMSIDSPDAVFGTILARLSGMVSHELGFDFLRGKRGSLNMCIALCAESGVGKTSGAEVAQDMIPTPQYLNEENFRDGVGVGSGEGIAELFMGLKEVETGEVYQRTTKDANKGDPKTITVKTQVRHNAFMYVDEGQMLSKMMDRKGATIGETIRSVWMGVNLGQQNANKDTTRNVPRRSYALGLAIGFQPDTVQELLADGGPGTPQRFLWLSAYDNPYEFSEAIDDEPPEPIVVRLPIEDEHGNPVTGIIRCPAWISNELRRERYEVRIGLRRSKPLDNHKSLMKCKLAALLAILDGRMRANDEDWELAGMIWKTSCQVRDFMIKHGQIKATEEREQRIADKVEVAERTQLAQLGVEGNVVRLAKKLADKVHAEGPMTIGAFRKVQQSTDRPACELAAEYAAQQEWIVRDGEKVILAGPNRP